MSAVGADWLGGTQPDNSTNKQIARPRAANWDDLYDFIKKQSREIKRGKKSLTDVPRLACGRGLGRRCAKSNIALVQRRASCEAYGERLLWVVTGRSACSSDKETLISLSPSSRGRRGPIYRKLGLRRKQPRWVP